MKGNPSVPVQGSPEESKQVSPTSCVNVRQAFSEPPGQNNRKSHLLIQSISHSHWLKAGLAGFASHGSNWLSIVGSCVFCAPLDRRIGRHIGRVLIDMSIEMSHSIYRPTYQSICRLNSTDMLADMSTENGCPVVSRHVDR